MTMVIGGSVALALCGILFVPGVRDPERRLSSHRGSRDALEAPLPDSSGDRGGLIATTSDTARTVTAAPGKRGDGYKWVALSNTTVGVLLATIDASIMLIAMPDIFRGIGLNPLDPANSFYLLWMILGFLIVSSVLVVGLGRLGDIVGRVRIYNLGFVIYTAASLLLTIDWMTGPPGAIWLMVFRVVQGIGAACLIGNSAAILTDAFPPTSAGSRWVSTTSRASAACSSVSCSAACSRPSTGASCFSCRCPSASSAPSGRT